jgi:hypothetical protein
MLQIAKNDVISMIETVSKISPTASKASPRIRKIVILFILTEMLILSTLEERMIDGMRSIRKAPSPITAPTEFPIRNVVR